MKKALTLTIIFIASISFAQSRSSLMKAALVNANATDTFLLRDSVLCYLSGDAYGDSAMLHDLVTFKFIGQADMNTMLKQLSSDNHSVWSKDSIAGAVVLPSATLPSSALSAKKATKAWTKYFTTQKHGFFEVGKPLFSLDGKSAVVYTAFQCGVKCGNGGATLFQWKNDKWIPVKNLYSWRK